MNTRTPHESEAAASTQNTNGRSISGASPRQPSFSSMAQSGQKRKFSNSADVAVTNANSTASMFLGPRRHSWMQSGASSLENQVPQLKRVKTSVTKPQAPHALPTPISAPAPPAHQSMIMRDPTAESVVITIPDTQIDNHQGLSPEATTSEELSVANQILTESASRSRSTTDEALMEIITMESESQRSTASNVPSPVYERMSSEPSESHKAPLRDTAPAPDRNSLGSNAPIRQIPTPARNDQPVATTRYPPRGAQEATRRPRVITSIPSARIANLTPPLASPLSAPVASMADLVMQSTPTTSTIPSPLASPQINNPNSIDVPKYLSDGSCEIHKINLLAATIEDHNLLIAEMQRVGQQIKDSAVPNKNLVVRYSKLSKALDFLRSQINPTSLQSPQELVSDIIRRSPTVRGPSPMNPTIVASQNSPPAFNQASIGGVGPMMTSPAPLQSLSGPSMQHNMQQLRQVPIPQAQRVPALPQTGYYNPPNLPNQAPLYPQQSQVIVGPSDHGFSSAQADVAPPPQAARGRGSITNGRGRLPPQPPLMQAHPHTMVSQTPVQMAPVRMQPPRGPQQIQHHQRAVLHSRQQPPPRQAMTPVNNAAPHSAVWSLRYLEKFQNVSRECRGGEVHNDGLRINLLEDAFRIGDDVFVALHLVYCTCDHPTLKARYPVLWNEEAVRLGLELLSQLLFPNGSISVRVLDIFVTTPFELADAMATIHGFSETFQKAMDILRGLRPWFDEIYQSCVAGRFECPSLELTRYMFSLEIVSPSLQRVISVSLTQMLKHRRASQAPQGPATSNQIGVAPLLQQNPPHSDLVVGTQPSAENQVLAPAIAFERPEFHIFTSDWGGKIPGWKLITDWKYIPADLRRPAGDSREYYSFFNRCITPLVKIGSLKPTNISFLIEGALSKSYPKDDRLDGTALAFRPVQDGTRLYRLRCVMTTVDLTQPVCAADDFSAWRSEETTWPVNFFAEVNKELNEEIVQSFLDVPVEHLELAAKRKLHFRRKKKWTRDCATDITDCLITGENTLEILSLDAPPEGNAYYLAVEEMEIATYDTLMERIEKYQCLNQPESKANIIQRLQVAKDAMADDDEISVVDDTVTVSVICPISQSLCEIPVRGKHCKHLDCFDLKSFLTTRPKFEIGVSVPDLWKCPIAACDCECTPPLLIMDGFMQETVTTLRTVQAEGRRYDDTKSIVIRYDGMWRPNDPSEGSSKKKIKKEPVEVIEID